MVIAKARGAGNAGGVNPDVPADWSPTRTRPLCPYPQVAPLQGQRRRRKRRELPLRVTRRREAPSDPGAEDPLPLLQTTVCASLPLRVALATSGSGCGLDLRRLALAAELAGSAACRSALAASRAGFR